MIRKILLQNKTFFSIILVFILFFSMVLYFGTKKIYERESKWRDETGVSLLNLGNDAIQSVFNNFNHHLSFLKNLPSIKGFVESDFASFDYRNEAIDIFYKFTNITKEIYQVGIINNSGMEIVKIENTKNETKTIVPFSELYARNSHYHLNNIQNIKDKNIYSSIDLKYDHNIEKKTFVPVVHIYTSLTDDKGDKKGSLLLTIKISNILTLLPKGIFIQTTEGKLVALNSDGTVVVEESKYKFVNLSGQFKISNTDNIHYSSLFLSSKNTIIVGLHHSHIGLKADLQKLILISIIMLCIFFAFIGVISYFNISRIEEKNRAQRALMSSLVELTDWRDPETGNHLKRTQLYSRTLANQLHKNEKYQKTITEQFVQDIYDTAPLHDIGKVGVKDSILLKTGKLTFDEMKIMQEHVNIGRQVIQDVIDNFNINESFIIMARNICGSHHEKYNGAGYPVGLKSMDIPLESRIFALVDVYDALRSKRPYKGEIAHSKTVEIICSEIGEHFDPDVVEEFLKVSNKFEDISNAYMTKPHRVNL